MRGYYLHYRDISNEKHNKTGIDRKVEGQIKALNDAGCDCNFILCKQPETIPEMIASCLPFLPDGIDWPNAVDLKDADYIYIRRPRFASREMIGFLADVKAVNPAIKIIYEIPTFPYDKEMSSLKMRLAKSKDVKYRKYLSKYVDYIADLSGTDYIFAIPTVQIINGIDLARVKERQHKAADDSIHLLCVAMFMDWHAADRIIEGIAEYENSPQAENVMLHLVGEGEKLPSLRSLTKSLKIEDRVVFHGYCDSHKMDELYDMCDVAVASLGFHRIGVDVASTLKTREYLAKGIPFVYSGNIDVFVNNPVDFCMKIPADDSPVDIEDVVNFFRNLTEGESVADLTSRIRAYAEEHVGMDAAMSNVVKLLKEEREHA